MNNYLSLNRDFLLKRNPHFAVELEKGDESRFECVMTKKGEAVPLALSGGKKISLHSKFDPCKEASRLLDGVDVDKHNLFVIFGFGYAYHIEELLKRCSSESIVLVVEKSYDILKSAFIHRDLSALFADDRLLLLVDPGDDDIAKILKGRSSKNVAFISHRGSYQLDQEYYNNLQRKMKSYFSAKEVNIATLAKFEKLWTLNTAKNAPAFIKGAPVSLFYDSFKGYDALVVCAGPSLLESIPAIREARDHVIIVAVDTTYKVLISHGIKPHFCLCVDPQLINARYFEGLDTTSTVLVADPTVHPSVFRLFKGPYVICSMPFDSMKWLEELCGTKGEITHGGSVSTNAYDFTCRLGADRIFLAGQDLSFTDRLAHCRGSYIDEMMFLRVERFFNQEMYNRTQLTALPKIELPAIHGGVAHTNQKMVIFKQWFEKHNDSRLINITPKGLTLSGIQTGSLDMLKESQGEDPALLISKILQRHYDKEDRSESALIEKRVKKKIGLLINENDYLGELLEKAIDQAEKLIAGIKKGAKDVPLILTRLDELDTAIQSRSSSTSIVGMSVQKTIHTITEGYDVEEELTHQKIAERSLFLYKGLLEGSLFIGKILRKMDRLFADS